MLFPLVLLMLVPLSFQQCLTQNDDVRKVKESDLESLLNSELQFSLDMARTVTKMNPGQNVFFSPTSVYRALLFTYFLAANQTESSLRKTLLLDGKLDKLDYMGAYKLENYYQKLRSIKKNGCVTNMANRMYVDRTLDKRVKQCMRLLLSDELQPANFVENVGGVRRKINHWVESLTNNVMKDFLGEDSISENTQLVLLNVAYFKGLWKDGFDPENTRHTPFFLSNGTKVEALMMSKTHKYKTITDQKLDAEVLELPYLDKDISMFILLPRRNTPTTIEDMLTKIDQQTLLRVINDTVAEDIYDLSIDIPKFTMEESLQLVPILEKMGVGDLFKDTADLSMLTGSNLFLTDAIHKAKVKVDEKGTEAAAVTVMISPRIGPSQFLASQPFVFILFDKSINKMLFFGVFASPP